jgi:hypothetical protein
VTESSKYGMKLNVVEMCEIPSSKLVKATAVGEPRMMEHAVAEFSDYTWQILG